MPFPFEEPTQVAFKICGEEETHAGIAFNSGIICGCCGGAISADEVEAIRILPWIDIEKEILGDVDQNP